MKPYYEQDGITIYNADCREVLLSLEIDAQTSIVVSDPPYGIALANHDLSGHRRDRSFHVVGDSDASAGLFVLNWAGEMPVVFFASHDRPWPGQWRNRIVWDKGGAVGGGGDTEVCLKRSWELIQVARNGPLARRDESVWRHVITGRDSSLHVCQKPLSLMVRLLTTFALRRETVIDPFAGSGSTLVAAKQCGNAAIGIEIEERYCEIAANRLSQGVLNFAGGTA